MGARLVVFHHQIAQPVDIGHESEIDGGGEGELTARRSVDDAHSTCGAVEMLHEPRPRARIPVSTSRRLSRQRAVVQAHRRSRD
jgi:hypothetical protein